VDWLYYILLLLLLVTGLFINILGLPGLWLMVGAAGIYVLITDWQYAGWSMLVALLVLALLAELVEFVAGAAGSKAAGGSKRGMVGAIIGGIIGGIAGTPWLPIIGTIIGACIGSFIGAFVIELLIGRGTGLSTRIGWGAAKGRLYGIVAKSAFGLAMLILAAVWALPFVWRGTSRV
jgi:uncharacterized protein